MQFLIKHKEVWKDPFPVEVLNAHVGKNRDKITGVLRMSLTMTSAHDKPAFVEFELTNTPEGWKYTKFGKLILRKSIIPEPGGQFFLDADEIINNKDKAEDYSGRFSNDMYKTDIVLTLEEGELIPPEQMIPTEYVWYVMFYDEISGFGLGIGDKLMQAMAKNKPESVINRQIQQSPEWESLLNYGNSLENPEFAIRSFEFIDHNNLKGTIRLFSKGLSILVDFKLEKTENGWRYTNLSNLRKYARNRLYITLGDNKY